MPVKLKHINVTFKVIMACV